MQATSEPLDTRPNLAGRMARCSCGQVAPSHWELNDFQFQGPGSRSAAQICICGYHRLAHHGDIRQGPVSPTLRNCQGFEPRGDLGYDHFRCEKCEAS